MFEFNPDLVAGDDDEAGDDVYERETDNDEMEALGNVRGSGADQDGFISIDEID